MIQSEINEILAAHKKWLNDEIDGKKADLRGANLRGASLIGADLKYADLTEADLTSANLTDADIDYSCLPLWCGSLGAKFDKKHYIQFLYHTLKSLEANDLIDEEFKKSLLTPENVAIANRFHRVDECGEISAWQEQGGQPHAT